MVTRKGVRFMPPVDINYLAVLGAAIVAMAIGAVWFGPVFGKTWMKLVGKTEKDLQAAKAAMPRLYGSSFLASLITAYVLAHFVDFAQAETISGGVQTGFWAWLGFVLTTSLSGFIWAGRPMKLYYLENGSHLITLAVMGAILAVWV